MSYTTLVGSKGSAGSLMNWTSYSKLDTATVLDEAQSLLYQILRVREMRTEWTFGMAVGAANAALPARFLDPIGRIFDITNGTDYGQVIDTALQKQRSYDNSLSGAFGTDPFTSTLGSSLIAVTKTAHGLNQDSTITIAGSNQSLVNSTFPVVSITDADNFVLESGITATGSSTFGGSSATYTANNLIAGLPSRWAVWDEEIKFDVALDTVAVMKLLYYRSPLPLSSSNTTNWLTSRYPKLLRVACMAAAAEYMKDDTEFQKMSSTLSALVGSTAAENDLIYRGAIFGTDTPNGS